MTRRDEIVLMLRSWYDFFPWPQTWTAALELRSTLPGPAPSLRLECPECGGGGERRGLLCFRCHGRGSLMVDDYTGEEVTTEETSWTEILGDVVDCDSCAGRGTRAIDGQRCRTACGSRICAETGACRLLCERCEGTGKRAAPLGGRVSAEDRRRERIGDARLDGMDDQHRRRDALLAYRQLGESIAELKRENPGVVALLGWIYVLGQETDDTVMPATATTVEWALGRIAARLPEDFTLPRQLADNAALRSAALVDAKGRHADPAALGLRNAEIRRLYDGGEWSLSALGRKFNLARSTVQGIVTEPGKETAHGAIPAS